MDSAATPPMITPSLDSLAGTRWAGRAELWLDGDGDQASRCECEITFGDGELHTRWSHEGTAHQGRLWWDAVSLQFTDTFHAREPMRFRRRESWALLDAVGTYRFGDSPEWGWEIGLGVRPSGELVLWMTNITPWGEPGRAVRMVLTPA